MWTQALAAVLVVGCDITALVAMCGTYLALLNAQQDYYASCHFADLFVCLEYAPLKIASRVVALPGVSYMDACIVPDVMVNIPGLSEPAMTHLISILGLGWPMFNLLHLQNGRYTAPDKENEVLVSAAFAGANSLRTDECLSAILNDRWKRLHTIDLAISPEYVYEAGAGFVFPGNRHYGVIWMGGNAISAAFRVDGAFNDLILSLDDSVPTSHVIAQIDRTLLPCGGLRTISHDHRLSNRFIADEVIQDHVTATYVSTISFLVTIFLLQNVLTRLIDTQRSQIDLMKAFGYSDLLVGLHYLQLRYIVAAAGAVIGTGKGLALGTYLTDPYARYYRLTHLEFHADFPAMTWAFFVSSGTAVGGAIMSTVKAMRLMPVEALRAVVPPVFSMSWVGRTDIYRQISVVWRVIVHNIACQPTKSLLDSLTIACTSVILIVGGSFFDSIDLLFDIQFQQAERQDVMMAFPQPLSHRVIYVIERLPGVLKVGGLHDVPVKLSAGYRPRRVSLSGVARKTDLHRLIDDEGRPLYMPPDDLVVLARLATVLGTRPGDPITIEMLEGERQTKQITSVQLSGGLADVVAYMSQYALAKLLREGGNWSGAGLPVDQHAAAHLCATLKRLPMVSAVVVCRSVITSFYKIMDESVCLSTSINFAFACMIAFGVAFDGMRIAYSGHAQQLASPHVLGFTRVEVV